MKHVAAYILLFLVLGLSHAALAQEPVVGPPADLTGLDKARAHYQTRLEQLKQTHVLKLNELQGQYVQHLRRLRISAQEQGDLDMVLWLTREQESIQAKEGPGAGAVPPAAKVARDHFLQTRGNLKHGLAAAVCRIGWPKKCWKPAGRATHSPWWSALAPRCWIRAAPHAAGFHLSPRRGSSFS